VPVLRSAKDTDIERTRAKARDATAPDFRKFPIHPTIPHLGYKRSVQADGSPIQLLSFESTSTAHVTAKDLIPGQRAIVSSFSDAKLAAFLAERGVVAGEMLCVERVAPFGDPIAIRVSDHLLCLRKTEASAILVQPEAV
jgi:ferrous iron transport protein A